MSKRSLLLVASLGALAACAAPSEDDTSSSEAAATEGHYIQANSPFFWASSSYEDFQASLAVLGSPPGPTPLGDDDAITVRLQAWVDRYDAVVRKAMSKRFHAPLAAPKPIVKVLPSSNVFNAWVSPVVATVGGRPAPAVDPDGGAPIAPTATLATENAVYGTTAWQAVFPDEWTDTNAFTKLWNGAKARCKLAVASDGATVSFTGSACAGAGTYAAPIATTAASPYIHVSTDLVAAVSEQTMAVVLAHELTHYYRSHVSSLGQRKYGFWYDMDPSSPRIPVPSHDAAALEAEYQDIVSGPAPVAEASFKGAYSPRLRKLLIALGPELAAQTTANPSFACAQASAALGGTWTQQLLVNGSVPDDMTRAAYEIFEGQLGLCAGNVNVAMTPQAGEMNLSAVTNQSDYRALGSPAIADHTTLAAALATLNQLAAKVDDKAAAFLKDVQTNRIGLYTTEQEADEMALDVATKAGIAPGDVLEAWVDFMRAIEAAYGKTMTPDQLSAYLASTGDLDANSCERLLKNDFVAVDEDGTRHPRAMVIGVLDEPHHASCYRLYNLWREQKAHHYAAAAAPADLAPAWSEIQAHATEISNAATPQP